MSCSFWIQRKKKALNKNKQSPTSDKKVSKKQDKGKPKC